jgi:hypothetical protein
MTKTEKIYKACWGGQRKIDRWVMVGAILLTACGIYFGLATKHERETRETYCLDRGYTHFVISKDDRFYCLNEGNGKILKTEDPVK